MPRKKSTSGAESAPGFEDAIAELEEIVASLEEESLPLEEMVLRFEQGTKLLRRCEEVLGSARKRLRTIASRDPAHPSAEDDDGKPLTPEASASTDAPDDDDEIRLF